MSNKRLKTITFPGLDDVYTIPDEAPEYSASATYKVGDFVVYGGALYKCNTAIESAEDWTAAHWTVTKMGNEVSGLKTAITHMKSWDNYNTTIVPMANYGISIAMRIITNVSGTNSFYFAVTPNTEYKIKRTIISSRFVIATTKVLPANNVAVTQIIRDDTAYNLTITAGNEDNYVVVMPFVSSLDTQYTWQEILNSFSIEIFNTTDPVAREEINEIQNYKSEAITSLWHINALNTSDGLPTSNNARLRTETFISYPEFVDVTCINTAEILIFAYNQDGSYVGVLGNTTWGTTAVWKSSFKFSDYPNYIFRIVVRNSTNTSGRLFYEYANNVIFKRNLEYIKPHYVNPYKGSKANLFDKNYSIMPFLYLGTGGLSDCDIYGNYLVAALNPNKLRIFDLTTKELLNEITYSFDFDVISNTLSFSNTFYSASDPLPLLYIRANDNHYAVIRFTSLQAVELIKTYTFGSATTDAPQAFWDFKNNRVYVLTSTTPISSTITFTEYDMSDETLEEDGSYTLAVIRTKDIVGFSGNYRQGGKYHNGKLYVGTAKTGAPFDSALYIINPLSEIPSTETIFEFNENDMSELEAVIVDKEHNRLLVGDYTYLYYIDIE